MNDEFAYWLAFDQLTGANIGSRRVKAMLDHFGNLKDAWQATESELKEVEALTESCIDAFLERRKEIDPAQLMDKLDALKIKAFAQFDPLYPAQLKHLKHAPLILYVKGNWDLNFFEKALAVVGTREPSKYAIEQVHQISFTMASLGYSIVSGMALGVDSAAHKGALQANNGKTIAVLANGVDMAVPSSCREIYDKILESGGAIVSEYPPRTQPEKGYFPARNRIIAALSQAVLIGEAGAKSGALITAERAVELQKPIFGLAGIPHAQNEGILRWIRKGLARLVTSTDDILEEMNVPFQSSLELGNTLEQIKIAPSKPKAQVHKIKVEKVLPSLNEFEEKIYSNLSDSDFKSVDKLMEETSLPITKINAVLMTLEMKKLITRDLTGAVGRK